MAHDGCDRLTGDAYSSYTLNPTSDVSRGPFKHNSPICISYLPVYAGFMRLVIVCYIALVLMKIQGHTVYNNILKLFFFLN
jgi:hypothetical protein